MTGMDWRSQSGSGPKGYEDFLVPAMFAPFAERLVEHAGVRAGSLVLDVACGTGAVSRAAARLAGLEGAVTGVDLGEPTLAVARAWQPEASAARIEYVQSDATALPLEDETFDVALCQQGLQFFPDRAAALLEIRRMLKPDGRVAIATWKHFERTPFAAIAEALFQQVGPEVAQMMRAPWALSEAAELSDLISAAGFHGVEVFEETISCTWSSHSQFAHRAINASPMAGVYNQAPEEAQRALTEAVAAQLAPYAVADDRLCMEMTSNVALAKTPSGG